MMNIWASVVAYFVAQHQRMPLYFYNTLSKEKELFLLPSTVSTVRMYNCGPTVYDRQHIGNLSAAVFADLLRRVLEFNGYSVKQVINITDFGHLVSDADDGEDKMTKGLKREKKALTMANMHALATTYLELYLSDIATLNIAVDKIKFPRASDYVGTMIAMIQTLQEKGYAYTTTDGVYFDTARFQGYGALGGITSVDSETKLDTVASVKGKRIAQNTEKHSQHDFALWKSHKKLGWNSPWGMGFPGWHLECSAMINSILGKQIDIHTGGIEHIAIHHNNEIAQSEAVSGKRPLSRFWMHREHIKMGDAKLAKSTGNTAYLSDVLEKGYHPLALRYWFMTSHYRTPANFTWEALAAASQAYLRLHERMALVRNEAPVQVPDNFKKLFHEHLNNDLDTAGAIASLWEALKNDAYSSAEIRAILLLADSALGLNLTAPDEQIQSFLVHSQRIPLDELPPEVQQLLAERTEARVQKNWKRSDELRAQLETHGYTLKDAATNVEVFRK